MEDAPSITLLDNTAPSQPPPGEQPSRQTTRHERQGSLSKTLSRASLQKQISKRKYAKWQPERLGLPTDSDTPLTRESSQARGGSISGASSAGGRSGWSTQQDSRTREADTIGSASSRDRGNNDGSNNDQAPNTEQQTGNGANHTQRRTEMDILYENQRGWSFFGIPLYSHSSLLNLDPAAWMTQDRKDSPVNITNAQLPDPSWEWAWRTWYVDMSGDVDEQGWQYSFSFSSSAWHGTHPWFHSFVRRRRWVRLRVKVSEWRQRGRSDLERAHMLNEDYFTIHSFRVRSREQSSAALSQLASGYLSRVSTKVEEEEHPEEIRDIPSLMHAIKQSSVDRQKIDALKSFVQDGGEELYYLNDKIPEIMSMFLFQTSRWQFVSYLLGVIQDLSQQTSDTSGDSKDVDAMKRKKDNLARGVESCKRHIIGPDIFTDDHGESASDMLDLTPVSRHDTLLSKRPKAVPIESSRSERRREIRGIPSAAEMGREGHIY